MLFEILCFLKNILSIAGILQNEANFGIIRGSEIRTVEQNRTTRTTNLSTKTPGGQEIHPR